MAEERPTTSGFDEKRTGASYASQWNRFVAWCEASGISSLPASPEDVAAYLKDRRESGAKPSTLKVAAATIARSHREAGFDVSAQQGVARTVLDELTPDDSPGAIRALPLDLDCYLAIRKVAKEQRSGRGGHEERVSNARRRGALDVAMIGLMRAPGERGGCADLGRRGAGARRHRFRTCRRDELPGGERGHHEVVVTGPQERRQRRVGPGHETQPDSYTDKRSGETGWIGRGSLGGTVPGWA